MSMINHERISSGIEGLDVLMNGGIIKNSINSIVGSSGTGKTTFALAYLYQGLLEGDHTLYLSFEETPSKLIGEAESLGINIREMTNDAEDLIHLVESELAQKLKHRNVKHTRIIVDPLTPILWEFPSEKEQRKVLTKIYHHLSSLGTVLQTVEESNAFGQTDIGAKETRVPIYLSDSVIHIQNLGLGGKYNRTCKVVKSRKTPHHEGIYPLNFVNGPGLVIDTSSIQNVTFNPVVNDIRYQELMKRVKELSKDKDPKKRVIAQIAKNLLGERENRDSSQNMEFVEVLTNKQILQEVRK
ncbi:MAG: RAD55 family ATPase [Candidatus Heimdallarchaeaceae archaeon]